MDFSSHSQAGQDTFVLNVLKHKKNGWYVEIGTHCPISLGNNTYFLERDYEWRGLMVEYDRSFEEKYKIHRPKSWYIIDDARRIDYYSFLKEKAFPKEIDYLQIDLDVNNRSTLDTLELFDSTVFTEYKFATITFEHDIYTGDYFNTRAESRKIFEKRGYILVFPDVQVQYGGWNPFEDWYVHPDLVDMDYVNRIKCDRSLTHIEIDNRYMVS